MSRVELAPGVGDNFERILEHLEQHEVEDTAAPIGDIIQAFNVLETNPHIGRPTAGDLRELIIGRHSRSYAALYRYVPEIDTVFVLALRGQREAGYKREQTKRIAMKAQNGIRQYGELAAVHTVDQPARWSGMPSAASGPRN